MEVLFTLIADRYERTSIVLSSNLPFSKWEQIFKDPMTTAAAIAWFTEVRYLRGRCPFCGPVDTPNGRSFVVHVGRKLFKCFRCNLGGNVLDLWSRYRKMELNDAATELCKLLHDHPTRKSRNQESQPPWTQI